MANSQKNRKKNGCVIRFGQTAPSRNHASPPAVTVTESPSEEGDLRTSFSRI